MTDKPGFSIELLKHQQEALMDRESKAIAVVTGFGGGKSMLLTTRMIIDKLLYPDCDLLLVVLVYSNFRDIFIPLFDEILTQTNIEYDINKTTGEIKFGVGGRIIVKSADDPAKIIGFNVLNAYIDEFDVNATKKALELFNKVIARCRKTTQDVNILTKEKVFDQDGNTVKATNQVLIGTTPEGWRATYHLFVKNKPDNYRLIKGKTQDNIFLPKDYVESLRAIYPSNLIEAYLNGEFVNLTSGSVFNLYDREKNNTKATYKQGEKLLVGIDFNVLGISAVIYAERESLRQRGEAIEGYPYNDKPTLHAVDHLQKLADTPDLIRVLKEKFTNSQIICYPDASGKNTSTKGATLSDISILKQAGFQCKHPKKNPNILDRVKAANSAFDAKLVRINQNKCPDLVEALEQQVYNEKTELPEKNAGAGTVDDITDSATYAIHFLFPIKKRSMKIIDYKENGR